ncbi:helix-turn-helix domain-containing protein [Winogradskyella psychrotolerans]|uniref:helix-turn-helix domain-containing protein n=1 Tax=Winogradskyella psychrotolerans TaxID=1344585 RepID=UPI001C065BC7|nr:helix-turn-helix domain-containing protein [Winogradskyella psychrotolerans]MBU2928614.1 helix-turn-helix domain-containing protein [Winogradskyella psychrotolerans]
MKQKDSSCCKIIRSIIVWAGLLLVCFSHAQDNKLITKAQELVFSNPDESLKIAEHILTTSQKPEHIANSNLLIAKAQIVKGDYNEAVIHAFDKNNLVKSISKHTQLELNLLKAQLLRRVYLDKQAQEFIEKSSTLSENLPQSSYKDSIQCLIKLEQIYTYNTRRNSDKAIHLIENTERQFNTFLKTNTIEKRALYLAKERAFNNLSQYDSAVVYIEKTLDLLNVSEFNDLYQKALIYKELGYLYLQKKEFSKSEESLSIASRFAEIINNPILLMEINRDLSISYLASNQNAKHKIFNEKYLSLNAEVERTEQMAVNSLYTLLSDQDKDYYSSQKETHNNYLYLLIAGLLGAIVIGGYLVLKGQAVKKRRKEIIKYLEIVRNKDIKSKPVKKAKPKRIPIPEETEQLILSKLKRFEASKKFLNKDISLAVLAGQFDTNTKYLSGVINKHYDDNFNTFINKLRVNYVIDKLKNDPHYINYKISFLAEESGYSSHSSFATVFKSIVGMSPVTFIKLIQKERAALKKNTTS